MEFLVEFEVEVPDGTPETEVEQRERIEASATATRPDEGHLLRLWRRRAADGTALGLYRADFEAELDGLLGAPPPVDWTPITVSVAGRQPGGVIYETYLVE